MKNSHATAMSKKVRMMKKSSACCSLTRASITILTPPVIKDSGKRQKFSTGSVRDTREGKGRFDLLPWRALRLIAIHMEEGAKKYGERNWEKGQPLSRYMDSDIRHAASVMEGKVDEPHLVAHAWNALAAIETLARIKEGLLPKELNDLP